ncbi:MAG: helix-turn-helix domain-containing protein [Halobaculum sp.]
MIEECLVVAVRVTGDGCPLAAASRAAGVSVAAEPPSLRRDGNALLRFSATPDDGLAETLDADDRIRYLHRSRGGGAGRAVGGGGSGGSRSSGGGSSGGRSGGAYDEYRCLSLAPCVVHDLTDRGFMAESLTYDGGEGRFVGAVVGREVLGEVMEAAGDAVGVRLEQISPLDTAGTSGRWDLTPAQAAALRTAHRMDYFAVPKGATAEEVAGKLGIGKSAFLERLRRGQSSLFDQLFG